MVKILEDPEKTVAALADFIAARAKESISRNGRFTIALSGGSSPNKLYQLLGSAANRSKIEWSKVFFFFGDERYVPQESGESNFRMAREALFLPLNINEEQIYAVDTRLSPPASAMDYEKKVVRHFQPLPCRFDLVLLGLGDNSHTASLFPHTSILHEKQALVKEVFIDEVNMFRITFTAPLINLAHGIVFLVYGASKAEAVRHILEDPFNPEEYPAQLVRPDNGSLDWFLDKPAAKYIV